MPGWVQPIELMLGELMDQGLSILFRTDASLDIGNGHVMRCLTLANEIRQAGAVVRFVCREHGGHLCELIEDRGFSVRRLPGIGATSPVKDKPAHVAWLGSSWQSDAEQTREAIEAAGKRPDWLVVDHYALDERWEGVLRTSVGRIMVIDDLADRRHDCDLLLDQNLVPEMHTRYLGKIPEGCGMLLGPNYALLQQRYAELHDRMPPRSGPIGRIFICFGGADSENLTGRALAALLHLNRPGIEVDVVVSEASRHADAVRQQASGHTNVRVHGAAPSLATLIAKADLAIGTAGATSWERLCLGLPTVVVNLAENQRAIAEGLNQSGLIRWLGHQEEVDNAALSEALGELIDQGSDEKWSTRCLAMVDGKGADRVCAALTVTASTPLRVRHARVTDESLLLERANDPTTRRNAFSPEPISPESHRIWFRARLHDLESCHLYLVETEDSIPIGHVCFDRVEQAWEMDYVLEPHFRGRGLGRPLLEAALLELRKIEPGALTVGQVKESNRPSCRPFGSPGFDAQTDGGGLSIGLCSDANSWINTAIPGLWLNWLATGHHVSWAHDAAELPSGDICFYLSYGRIVSPDLLSRYKNNLVVHESDLPEGRGWSPLTWQVLEGANSIVVTLFEAVNEVDSGPIYLQEKIELQGTELVDGLRRLQADATLRLCRSFISDYPQVLRKKRAQEGKPTYYRRRHPPDGELDPEQPLGRQFNLLRVSDNHRYPAWFEIDGVEYTLKIDKR